MIRLDECPVCHNDNWKMLDYLRSHKYWQDLDYITLDEKCDFKICKTCGFVTYDYVELDRLAEHYERQRPVLNSGNIITCNRKNEYHKTFLGENHGLFPMSKVLDVGCAQGSLLDFLHNKCKVKKEHLHGTEFSSAFRSFGKHEYGLNITKEIDKSIKYDFISYYHVLEHCQHPDKELQMVHEILEDHGTLYISVPTWFDKLEMDSGSEIVNFEDLFHMNHVNCFSDKSFRNLIDMNGFKIIKEAHHIYGFTVLCEKKTEKDSDNTYEVEDYKKIVKTITEQKEAISFFQVKQYDDSIKSFPGYPDAYIYKSLQKDTMQNLDAQLEILDEGLKQTPECMRLKLQKAKVYFQWDENSPEKMHYYGNNIKKSEALFKEVLSHKSGNEDIYYFLSMIELKYKRDFEKAAEYMKECMRINPAKFHECYNILATIWKEKENETG